MSSFDDWYDEYKQSDEYQDASEDEDIEAAYNAGLEQSKSENERYRRALQAIIKHQQTVGGDLSHLSTTLNIAKKALEPEQ